MRAQYRSEAKAWAASQTIPFSLDFIKAARKMAFPVMRELKLRCQLTMTTGATGMQGEAMAQFIAQILLKDSAGNRVSLDGANLRIVNIAEYGLGHRDPADIAANQGATAREFWLTIPMRPLKARKRRDFGIAVEELVTGSLEITTRAAAYALAATGTITTGTLTFVADIVDEHKPHLLSRMVFQDYPLVNAEAYYPVGGSIRGVFIYTGSTGEDAATGWLAQDITSRNLDLNALPHTLFQTMYERESKPSVVAAAAVNSDPLTTPVNFVIPVVNPTEDQHTTDMVDVDTPCTCRFPAPSRLGIPRSSFAPSPTARMTRRLVSRRWRASPCPRPSRVLRSRVPRVCVASTASGC
jgi:hypothetical protein